MALARRAAQEARPPLQFREARALLQEQVARARAEQAPQQETLEVIPATTMKRHPPLCGRRSGRHPRPGLKAAAFYRRVKHAKILESSGWKTDVQFGATEINLTWSLSSLSCAPQLSEMRATGSVVRARTAERKSESNQV